MSGCAVSHRLQVAAAAEKIQRERCGNIARLLRRLVNGIRKVAAGLRPFSESVWPGVRNDLFVAHQSIYEFFARYAPGKEVLDAGCGTGYGSRRLAECGAKSVVGVDLDAFNVRYARRHYPEARFVRDDIEVLATQPAGAFDLVVASNALEHLHSPAAFVAALQRVLRKGGLALIAVPPILSDADRLAHEAISYHRSNLTVAEWHRLFADAGFRLQCHAHRAKAGVAPNFESRRPSRLTADDFEFVATGLDGLLGAPSITAVFELYFS